MDERWLPVVGFDGYYEVSNYGRVRSLDRSVLSRRKTGEYWYAVKGRELSQTVMPDGRMIVSLSRDGKTRLGRVSVLVLEAFVGPRPPGMQGCHWDDDPSNNHLSNLRWGTPKQNAADRVRNGHHHPSCRTKCPREHDLFPPNLVPNRSARGCLACALTHSWARKRGIPTSDPRWVAESDRRYAEIMSGCRPQNLKDRTHCPRTHELRAPNLVASRSTRDCLACGRTNSWGRKRGIPVTDPRWIAEADRRYAEIMQLTASAA